MISFILEDIFEQIFFSVRPVIFGSIGCSNVVNFWYAISIFYVLFVLNMVLLFTTTHSVFISSPDEQK